MLPTLERVRELLRYDLVAGQFTWRVQRTPQRPAGSPAGAVGKRGYLGISIDRQVLAAHRLAWFYVMGYWPINQIDHIDGDRLNNRWRNLRDVPQTVNNQNITRAHADNKTGFLGVCRHKGRFVAYVRDGKRNRYLGLHDTPELAHAAYLTAKRVLHEGCTL